MSFSDLTPGYEPPHSQEKVGVPVEETLKQLGITSADLSRTRKQDLSGEAEIHFRQAKAWWAEAQHRLSTSRQEQLKDHEFYDGDQWDELDKTELEERGQPAHVFNLIAPAIDWLLGTERRTRIDYRVLPRTKDDAKGAEVKTGVLKYIQDVNHVGYNRSRAFEDAVISGLGWLEAGIRSDPEDEPIFVRYEDWRNIWYDSLATELDLSDARYLFRVKWVDVDVAVSMYPEHAGKIVAAAMKGSADSDLDEEVTEAGLVQTEDGEDWVPGYTESLYSLGVAGARPRVKLFECWYRKPAAKKIIKGDGLGTLNGALYNEQNEHMTRLVEDGLASVYDAIRMTIRCMVFCGDFVLEDKESVYQHNRFPFIPIFAKRLKKTGAPYGVVRNLRDPQEDLNKRRSKALHLLSSRLIIADDNATEDWDELVDEARRPDGVVRKRVNTKVELHEQPNLAEGHVALMNQDADYIQRNSGVVDELMGRETNAISGKAILSRQEQGHMVTAGLFDNLRLSVKLSGEILLSLVEQFYAEEKIVRLTDERNNVEFLEVNKEDEETGEVLNDITATKADFVVDAANYHATLRQAMFESFMELLGRMDPQIALQLLDLVVDLSDLPGKEEFVKRIRQVTGQTDPDADENDPEVQAEKMAQEKAKERQAQLAERMTALEVEEKETEIEKNRAEIEKIKAEIKLKREEGALDRAKLLLEAEQAEREAEQDKQDGEQGKKDDQANKAKKTDKAKDTQK